MDESKESKRNRPLFIAIAALGLLLYTMTVCAAAVAIDRRVLGRQKSGAEPFEADEFDVPAPTDPGALQLGERITAEGDCEFTVVDCAFSRQAFPPNATGESVGYAAGNEADGYVDLAVQYRNLNGVPANIDGITCPVLIGTGGIEYGAFAVIENVSGSAFVEVANVSSLRSARLHYLFLVPKEVGEGAFAIHFALAGQEYGIGFSEGFTE